MIISSRTFVRSNWFWRRQLQIGVDCGGGSWRIAGVLMEKMNRWELSERVCKRHTSRTVQKFNPPPFVCSGRGFAFIVDLVLLLPGRHFGEKKLCGYR